MGVATLSRSFCILIEAEIAGKIMTGNKIELKNGLTAFELKLGWTVLGKSKECKNTDIASTTIAMIANDAKIEELWSLDVLGIFDLIETVNLNKNNRYTLNLPWIDDHKPIVSNFDLAAKRLEDLVSKLNKEELFTEYDRVIREWLAEDIVELVPQNELDYAAHYLPHRLMLLRGDTSPEN